MTKKSAAKKQAPPQKVQNQPPTLVAQQKKTKMSAPSPPTSFTSALRAALPKGTFAKMGATGGGLFGPIGGKLGALLGGKIADITGFGSYKVSQNSLVARVDEGVDLPQFHNSEHATIIRHREFVRDITAVGGSAFNDLSFPLNPGMAVSFPYLANIAVNFESYQILGMIFEYRSTSADITAGGALGSVVLATDYNPVATAYTSKLVMENSEYSMSVKPSHDVVHAIECDPSVSFSPVKFVRNTSIPAGSDPRLYDWGNFQLATVGLPTSTGNLGELWVSYEIALFKPSLDLTLPVYLSDHFQLTAGLTAGSYFTTGALKNPTAGSTLKGSISGSVYTFPSTISSGTYLVTYMVCGNPTSAGNYIQFNCSNASQNGFFQGGTGSTIPMESTGNGYWAALGNFTVTGANATISITAGTLPPSVINGDLIVQQVSPSL
jgi:hypothetical protein